MVQGKLALVTGGGRGIGQATCQTLAKAGAKVVVTDLDSDTAEATLKTLHGSGHCSFQLDVSNEESVDIIFKSIIEKYKSPPTIIVNCAGIVNNSTHFFDETVASMQKIFDVNYKGTFMVTQRACKELIKHKLPGSIVNISSIATQGNCAYLCYSSSKAAVLCLTRGVGREMAQFGIRCNSVSPGAIDTDMLRSADKDSLKAIMKTCPARRIGNPQEVAELILFLSSEKSSYINATNMDINGGL